MAANRLRLVAAIADEDDEHEALARALTYAIGAPGLVNRDGVLWCSIEHRIRSASPELARREGAWRKRRGVVGAIPDVLVRWYARTIWCELKRSRDSQPSDSQRLRHSELAKLGDVVLVGFGWRDALDKLTATGLPMRRLG